MTISVSMKSMQKCERFKIPLFIVRSKADIHIKNIIQYLHGEHDGSSDENSDDHQARARQSLIDSTSLRNNLDKKLDW